MARPKSQEENILGHFLLDPKLIKTVELGKDFFRDQYQRIVFRELKQGHTDIIVIAESLSKVGMASPNTYLKDLTDDPLHLGKAGLQGPVDAVRAERMNMDVARLINEGSHNGNFDHEKIKALYEKIGTLQNRKRAEMIEITLADIDPQPVEWLWYNRIPLGTITLLCGDPNIGKSYLSLWMAAHITTGRPWPDAPLEPLEKGSVIVMTAEDSLAKTVRMRAGLMGADLKKLTIINAIRMPEGDEKPIDLTCHLAPLEESVKRHKDLKAVTLDLMTDYLGNIRTNELVATRIALKPLGDLAEKYNFSLIGITHMNKDEAKRAVYRVMGSMSFVGLARAVWLINRDEEDDTHRRRLFTPLKMNLGPDPTGLAFTINEKGVRFEEGTVITTTADEQLGDREARDTYSAIRLAQEFLANMLRGNPMRSTTLAAEAKGSGIGESTLRKAKSLEGIEAIRHEGHWYWGYPSDLFQSGLVIKEAD